MPTSRDLRRLIRQRMERTGESYTTARAHLIRRGQDAGRGGDRNTGSFTENPRRAEAPDDPRLMYDRGFEWLLNAWFARYEDARAALERNGGYLLPYDAQFLVAEAEAIRVLGLDPDDPDWERIGHDWVCPADREAWRRLREQRLGVLRGGADAEPTVPTDPAEPADKIESP